MTALAVAVVPRQTAVATSTIAAVSIGAAAAVVGWFGSWNPSYWGDEAATVLSAQRPIPVLLAELVHVDAVHGLYYLAMHVWVGAFGATELSTRAPSAIAVGLAAAGVVVLGARLLGAHPLARCYGIVAGLVFAVLPRTTFLATEARSYAISAAAAVWVTIMFVTLWQRREARRRPWVVYGVLVGLSTYLFLYLILLLAVHGAVLVSSADGRQLLRRWARSALVALAVALPMLAVSIAQRNQVSFLAARDSATPRSVMVTPWFDPGPPAVWAVPVLCWALILLGVGVGVVRALGRQLLRLGLAWLLIPTAALLAGNAWVTPMYSARYLSFTTPAAALLIAAGILAAARLLTAALPPRRAPALTLGAIGALLLALVVSAVPGYLAQRGPYAKDLGSDWRQVADYVSAHARRGDAIIFDPTPRPSRQPELAYRLYPAQFAAVDAVAITTPFFDRAALWDVVAPLSTVRSRLAAAPTVWALELPKTAGTPLDIADLTAHGYRVVGAHRIHRTVVYELRRTNQPQKEGT